jgi:probable F420-dependent oxidoreductase
MQIGVTFPQLEVGPGPDGVRAYAEGVEELGYRHLVTYEHVLGADHDRDDPRLEAWPKAAYDQHDQFHEPLTLFGYLAAITAELELATGILILPQRQTALVAKQAAEVDLLSGGRMRLGVALGWNQLEYEALGVPWEKRGSRLSEQIAVLRALWSEEVVDFEGDFHSLPKVGIKPLPERMIPIWTGANTPPAIRRAVRLADGIICAVGGDHPSVGSWVEEVRKALDEADRDPATLALEGRVDVYDRSREEIAADVERWRELGATHLSVNTMTPAALRDQPSPIERHLEMLQEFRRLVPA